MPPQTGLPPGACDTHVHIFEAEAVAGLEKKPEVASLASYLRQRQALGVQRTVLVQPSAFRFDNSALLTALAGLGASARAVVTVGRDVADATLDHLSSLGVRGARFHLLKSALQSWDDVLPVAERVWSRGWHVQVQCDGRELPDRSAAAIPPDYHPCGRPDRQVRQTGDHVTDPAFKALLRLVERRQHLRQAFGAV